MPTNTYTPIATYTVPSDTTTNITFSSIPQTYKHLLIKMQTRSTVNNEQWSFAPITSVGGTASNLSNFYTRFTLTASSDVQANSSMNFFYGNGPLAVSGAYGHLELYFADYASTSKYKTVHFHFHGGGDADNNFYHAHGAGLSSENTAVSTITFAAGNGYAAGTNITLYGLSNS
jgi:hypothetical protein